MTIKSNTPASDRYRVIEDYLYLDGDTVRYKKDSLKHPNHSHRAGDEIKTSINGSGYRQVCFAGIQMFVHVVVFALHNKRMPLKNIDHINGNRLDNSPKNLREASRIANSRNQKTKCNSRSGIKNVLWNKQKINGPFKCAQILAGCILGTMKILNLLVWLPVRLSTNITDNMRGLYD
ncbi:HNH endonuclease signature motif containing protein [Escherichia albertii]|nr:HNH endonuclease signature motif containing protein [Escherichia albertii]